jgi:hypothetical protein
MTLEHTIGYADLAAMWAKGERDREALPASQRDPIEQTSIFDPSNAFAACTAVEMRGWIDSGYLAPGMDIRPAANTRPRRKLRFDEEGELQVDMALSGHDTPFLNWGKRNRTPGLKLKVELAVRADTPPAVLKDYAQWLTALVAGMQAKGFDLEIDVVSRAKQVSLDKDRVDLSVRVKRFGRKSDLKSWGAILSPGGFRRLIFLGRALASEAHGRTLWSGMGISFGPSWGVDFDAKAHTMTVRCAASSDRFPREEMDRQLRELKI